jgi:hypothetical protein
MLITKIHLLPVATTGKGFLQIPSARTSRNLFKTPTNIFKIVYFVRWKGFFIFQICNKASHYKKAYNYLNIKEENLDLFL